MLFYLRIRCAEAAKRSVRGRVRHAGKGEATSASQGSRVWVPEDGVAQTAKRSVTLSVATEAQVGGGSQKIGSVAFFIEILVYGKREQEHLEHSGALQSRCSPYISTMCVVPVVQNTDGAEMALVLCAALLVLSI